MTIDDSAHEGGDPFGKRYLKIQDCSSGVETEGSDVDWQLVITKRGKAAFEFSKVAWADGWLAWQCSPMSRGPSTQSIRTKRHTFSKEEDRANGAPTRGRVKETAYLSRAYL